MTPNKLPPLPEKFRKRPVVIEAVQLDGTEAAFDAAIAFMGGASGAHNGHLPDTDPNKSWLYIDTLEGQMTAKTGDWIIKGVKGEFYPCKPDIFAATYEPAEALRQSQSLPAGDDAPLDDELARLRKVEDQYRAIMLLPAGAVAGLVVVPREPTEEMLEAGRSAVMARDCSGPKWGPADHYRAAGISRDGIPDRLFEGRQKMSKAWGAELVYAAMIAAAPEQALQADAREKGEAVLGSKDGFYLDYADDIEYALAFELEVAALKADDYVTVNRQKLHAIAVRVLEKAKALLAAEATQPAQASEKESQRCTEDDGCPTEMAVLKRFWRANQPVTSSQETASE